MAVRIITAVVALCVLAPLLIFSETVIFPIAAALFCAIAILEMLRCCGLHRRLWLTIPMVACAATVAYPFFVRERESIASLGMMLLMLISLYLFTCMVFSRGKITLQQVGIPFLTCFYIIASFGALVTLRYAGADGKYVYLISFIGAWVTDTFAYFCGKLFGKHKLIPEISPKKTVEGSIGGIVSCVITLPLYGLLVATITDGAVQANYLMLAISGLLISFVSQVGDLTMSAVKRNYDIKDYGRLFPGHGGVLDRFDSVMAVSVVLCVLSSFGTLFEVVG